ncbi:MAG: permease, partial [Sphaerochaetaceae bacterium]
VSILDHQTIVKIIGTESGWIGVVFAAIVGAVTLIPGFVAFPTAALLLEGGAGYMQIGAFISTLMMVGIVTLPVEMQYFGKRMAIYRNMLAFCFSFLVALGINLMLGVLT